MAGRLDGGYALVTGASRGIGEAIVRRFAEEGARVIATDVRVEEGEALAASLGETVSFRALDVTDERA